MWRNASWTGIRTETFGAFLGEGDAAQRRARVGSRLERERGRDVALDRLAPLLRDAGAQPLVRGGALRPRGRLRARRGAGHDLGRDLAALVRAVGDVVPERRHLGLGDVGIAAEVAAAVEGLARSAPGAIAGHDEMAQRRIWLVRNVRVALGIPVRVEQLVRLQATPQPVFEKVAEQFGDRIAVGAQLLHVILAREIGRGIDQPAAQSLDQRFGDRPPDEGRLVIMPQELEIDQRMRGAVFARTHGEEMELRVLLLLDDVRIERAVPERVEIGRQQRPLPDRPPEIGKDGVEVAARAAEGAAVGCLSDQRRGEGKLKADHGFGEAGAHASLLGATRRPASRPQAIAHPRQPAQASRSVRARLGIQ